MVYRPPSSSDLYSQLARDYAIQVNTGTADTPAWVFVRGLSQVTPSSEPTLQADSSIDDGGYSSQIATGQAFSLELQGNRKGDGDEATFTPDPGQEFLRKKGEETGAANIAQVRYWRTDSDPDAKEFRAAVNYTTTGGDLESLQGFTVTLAGRGRPTAIEKPAGAADDATPSTPLGGDPVTP